MKRVLSWIMILLLCLSLLPAGALAADSSSRVTYIQRTVQMTELTSIDNQPQSTKRLTDNYGNTYSSAVFKYYSRGNFEYLLNNKYSRFKGTLYVPEGTTSSGTWSMTVLADGAQIYASPKMTRASKPVAFDIDVSGCNDLKIEIDQSCLFLADARFEYTERHVCSAQTTTKVREVSPTCVSAGEAAYWTCSCGRKYADENAVTEITKPAALPALGHNWDAGQVTKAATALATGVRTYTCTRCGTTRTESIPKLPLKTGWVKESGDWHFYNSDGTMRKNDWAKDGSKWCWMNESGLAVTGWRWIDNDRYFFDSNGHAKTSCWAKSGSYWCWLGADGAAVANRWIYADNHWYYINANGFAVTNDLVLDGNYRCYLNASGEAVTNKWLKVGNYWYYFNASGHAITNTWKRDGSYWCWFKADGRAAMNEYVLTDEGVFWFDASGHAV